MKLVINTCFGGFGLSSTALKRWAELKGRECYFFVSKLSAGKTTYRPISVKEIGDSLLWVAFDIPNPETLDDGKSWQEMTPDERQAHNENHSKHSISCYSMERDDPDLIQVVEELGGGHREGASGIFAELTIVEIPDGVEYEIEQYDGNEHIAEKHRTWGQPHVGG